MASSFRRGIMPTSTELRTSRQIRARRLSSASSPSSVNWCGPGAGMGEARFRAVAGKCRLVCARIMGPGGSGWRAEIAERAPGPEGRLDGGHMARAILLPAIVEACQARPALDPADMQRMRPFAQPALAQAEGQVAANVVGP